MNNIILLLSDYKKIKDAEQNKIETKEELYKKYILCTNNLDKSINECNEILIAFYKKSKIL